MIPKDGGYVCLLCQDYKPQVYSIIIRHWEQKHKNHSIEFQGKSIYLCKKLCRVRGHYHCICGCGVTFNKKAKLIDHIAELRSAKCSEEITSTTSKDKSSTAKEATSSLKDISFSPNCSEVTSKDADYTGSAIEINGAAQCPQCALVLLKKNMKTHIRRAHEPKDGVDIKRYAGSCVDAIHGIYLVSEKLSGVGYPIHVQKFILGNNPSALFCESKMCEYRKIISGVSGIPSYECDHLRSVHFYQPPLKFELHESVLDNV